MATISQPGGAGYTDPEAVAAVEAADPLALAGDVTIDGAKSLAVDVISEKDADAGVTIETVVIKDGLVDGVDVSAISGGATVVAKAASEGVASSVALQDDDDFSLAVGTNEVWSIDLYLRVNVPITPGIKYSFSAPAGTTGMHVGEGYADNTVPETASLSTPTGEANLVSAAVMTIVHIHALFRTVGTAGTVQFRWAQSVSNASSTSIFLNSYMISHQIS